MKEKKKKRKFWMNRIVAFVTTVCMACVTFVVPAFAEETSGSSFTVYDGYSVSDGTYSHEFGADFSTDDVVVFVIEQDTTLEDTYGNVNRGVTYLFTSSSPFSGTWHFSRKANYMDWSEYKDGTISVDAFNEDYGCYNYWPLGDYWPTTVEPSFIGKYIRMRVPSSISSMDYGQFVKKYYSGEDISDYVIEYSGEDSGVFDESIGYLQNVQVKRLTTDDEDIFRLTFSNETDTGFKLYGSSQSESEEILYETYYYYHESYLFDSDEERLCGPYVYYAYDVSGIDYPTEEIFQYYFNFLFLGKPVQTVLNFIYQQEVSVDLYVRPYIYKDGKKHFGGWTKITIEAKANGNFKNPIVSNGLTDGLDFDNFEPISTDENGVIYEGHGSTIENADSNVDYTVNDSDGFSFDLSSVDDIGSYFENLLKSLIQSIGTVPVMIKTCFSFLPNEIILFLGGGLVLIVILRIFGR